MKKKRLLFVINSLNVGGAEKSLVSLLNLVDYARYDVHLQMFHRGGDFETLLPTDVKILPQLPYFDFCGQPISKQLRSGNIRFLKTRVMVRLALRKNEVSGNPLHATQAYWAGARDAFDVVPEAYDVAIAWGQGTPTHYVAEKVQATRKFAWINADYEAVGHNAEFDREIYGEYTGIVTVSERLQEKLMTVFPTYRDKFYTIYDINSAKLIHIMAEEGTAAGDQPGIVQLCTVGRLVEQKGYDLAIDAAEHLMHSGVNFSWNIIGEGPERPHLEQLIQARQLQERVYLLGMLTNPYPYVKAADIYVQTSRFEGFCLTLAEARILQKLCVSTCFSVVYDQLVNEKNGLIVDMNGKAIANGIQRVMEDEALRKTINHNLTMEKAGNEDEVERFYALLEGQV